jgi:Spy/CpxP family protein refolding chaperone
MKLFTKMAVVALLLLTAGTAAEAQGGGGRGMGGRGGNAQEMQQRQRELMFKDITLTEVQTKAVDSIQAGTREKQREMMQAAMGGGGDRQAMMAQVQELRKGELDAIRAVLTKEQLAQFEKNVAEMPAMGGRGRPPRQR